MTNLINEKISISLTIILIVGASCSEKEQKVIYRERSNLRLTQSRLDSLYSDSLMTFLEQGFDNTLIKIKIGDNVIFSDRISTAPEIQLASVRNIGSKSIINEFSISIDNGKFIPIKVALPFKYVSVSYVMDTVYIDYMMHYPMYE